jgi:hypothetical protein
MASGYQGLDHPPPVPGQPALAAWLARVVAILNGALGGKLNATLAVTLTANAGSTVVNDPRLSSTSFIGFCPLSADAAAEIAAGGLYVSSQGAKTMTLTHANNALNDRKLLLLIIG